VEASEAVRLAAGVLLLLALAACGDWSKPLGNGCHLVRTSGAQVLVAGPGEVPEILIHPTVDRYAVIGDWVVGHVSRPDLPPEDTVDSVPGFFLVSCDSGEVTQGLERADWLRELSRRSLGQPTLRSPSRYGSQ